MQNFTRRPVTGLVLTAASLALLPLAAPAMASAARPTTIKLPASSLHDPAARLCMPKSVLRTATADQPNTICQTQADWASAGVMIVAR